MRDKINTKFIYKLKTIKKPKKRKTKTIGFMGYSNYGRDREYGGDTYF